MKRILLALVALPLLAACSRTIPPEKYVDAMVALGCKGEMESSPAGEAVLKEQGVTVDQINDFRKRMDPKRTMQTAMEISRRVMECHGVKTE